MDDRHRQITQGKGLEESRLNTEFIDFLNKWSTPVLGVILAAALAWAGFRWWSREQAKAHNDAFSQYNEAAQARKPDNLLIVAREVGEYGSVGELATLRAAAELHASARRGVVTGGDPTKSADLLSPDQRKESLAKAADLYRRVLDATRTQPGMVHHELSARAGLAAVLIDQGETDKGRTLINEQIARAKELKFADVVAWNEERLKSLDAKLGQKPLLAQDQIVATFIEKIGAPAEPPKAENQPAEGSMQVPAGGSTDVVPVKPPVEQPAQKPEEAPGTQPAPAPTDTPRPQ